MNRLNNEIQESGRQRIEREYVERMKAIDEKYELAKAKNDRTFRRQSWLIGIVFVIYMVATFVVQVVRL